MECMTLRINDVDLLQNIITIRSGKGDEYRTGMIPEKTVLILLGIVLQHIF